MHRAHALDRMRPMQTDRREEAQRSYKVAEVDGEWARAVRVASDGRGGPGRAARKIQLTESNKRKSLASAFFHTTRRTLGFNDATCRNRCTLMYSALCFTMSYLCDVHL